MRLAILATLATFNAATAAMYPAPYAADVSTPAKRLELTERLWAHDSSADVRIWPAERLKPEAVEKPLRFTENELHQSNLVIGDILNPQFSFFPAKGVAPRPAVVVFPGGGYRVLGWNKEGTEVAKWFNGQGFSAFVLLYRTNDRDGALADAQRTMGIIRRDAAKYGVDPKRLGVIGFSAGANLAVRLSTNWRERRYVRVDDGDDFSCRPDFMMPIYPWDLRPRRNPETPREGWLKTLDMLPEYPVDSETPPSFTVQAKDDFCEIETALALDQALHKAGVPSTVRIYPDGGHGYGLRRLGKSTDAWSDEAARWLEQFAAADLARDHETLVASGPWEMAQKTSPDRWMPAVVPGTVLSTLVKNGVVPDPYYGLNNKIQENLIPDVGLGARDFYTATYRTKIVIPEGWASKTVWMRPEGINYRGEIRLNGVLAASTAGTFARNAVDVSEFLRPGVNDIEVEVRPVDHPGKPFQKPWGAPGEWSNGGDGEIGRNVTVLMGAGWDFMFSDGIRDRHAGIWKDIVFIATDKIRIDAPYVRTKLNEAMDEAELSIEVDLVNAGYNWGSKYSGVLEAEIPGTDIRLSKRVEFYRGERRTEVLKATLKNPRLWWPRNKGPQNLYTLNVRVVMDARKEYDRSSDSRFDVPESVSDAATIRFGVREVTSDQSGKGGARQFYVNRRKIFIRGTNWIPEGMLRQDDARMDREMRLTAESGVNLVRLWAGGIAESDRFYDLCDEYGLLVWQEFWMTGDTRHPDDPGLYLDCVAQQVKRIRHHPSLAHWVCSNESTDVQGVEELVKKLTGTTSWMQNSECDGVHDGSPYIPVNPMGYYDDTASGKRGRRVWGFSPEYGTCALPAADQCRKFMPERLLWPMDVEAWKYREGGGFDRMTEFHHRAVNGYGESKTFDEYCRKSQAADALAHRALWEAWNLARNEATGVLFWYNNTPVPQLGSHAWDYELDQTASFFAQKSALEPLHVQYEYLSNRVSVVSDLFGTRNLSVAAEVYDFESRKVWEKTAAANIDGEGCWNVFAIPFEELARRHGLSRPHFIRLGLVEGGEEIASTFYWRSSSEYGGPGSETGPCVTGFEDLSNLPKTILETADTEDGVLVKNVGDRIAFMVEVQCFDGEGRRIVPVHYSDNFFALMPGESRSVRFGRPQNLKRVRTSCWND